MKRLMKSACDTGRPSLSRGLALRRPTKLQLLGSAAILAGAFSCALTEVAHAQSGVPGLVISSPPPSGPPPSAPGLVVSTPQPSSPPAQGAAPPNAPGVAVAPARPPAEAEKPKAKAKPPTTASIPKQTDTPAAPVKSPQGIAALVNDEPITAFEVESRARFMALSSNISDRAKAIMQSHAQNPATNEKLKGILQETIQANQGKSREQILAIFEEKKKQFVVSLQKQAIESARSGVIPTMRKKAIDELIEERLKFQEAKRLNITVSDDDVERAFKGVAERNKMTSQEFSNHIKSQGADPSVMKSRFKTQLVWREVIKRRFGHTIAISNRDVDKLVENAAASSNEEQTELQLHKLTISTSGKLDQKILAQKYDEAEKLRARFQGCKSTSALAKDRPDIKFEDLGYRKPSSITEPTTRVMLLAARDNEMIPPNPTGGGVELYAVCGRKVVKVDSQKRQEAENELQMKEFERLAQRHIQDLRKDALIEIR